MATKINPENLYSPGDFAIFGGITPLYRIQKITGWEEKITGSGTLQREFTWSYDGLAYHEWESLTNEALQAIPIIKTVALNTKQFQVYLEDGDPSHPVMILSGIIPINQKFNVGEAFPYSYNWVDSTGYHVVPPGQILTATAIHAIYNRYISENGITTPGDFNNSFNNDFLIDYTFVDEYPLTLEKINECICNPIYIKFRFTLLTGGPLTIYPITPIAIGFSKEPFAGAVAPQACSESGCRTGIVFDGKFSYNIMNQNPLGGLFDELTNAINQMVGLPVQYYRFDPIQSSADVILKEWTLYNVDPTCYKLKIVVPKNEFPDNKVMFSAYQMDFDMPFEVQVGKDYYESIIGSGKAPQKRDILFFNENNRIYEITSSTLEKNFMQIGIYYKLSLVKHQPKSNTIYTKDFQGNYDLQTISSEEIFGQQENLDMLEITNPQQTSISQKNYDPVRGFVLPALSIPSEKILNYYTMISDGFYDMNSLIDKTLTSQVAVQYNKIASWSEESDRGLSVWFRQPTPPTYKTYIPDSCTFIGGTGTLAWSKAQTYQVGQEIMLYNSSVAVNGIVTNLAPFTIQIADQVVANLNNVSPGWQYQNFKTRQYLSRYLMNCYNNGKGWYLKIHSGISGLSYLEYKVNTITYYYFLPQELALTTWYGLHMNMSHQFQELNLNIWSLQWNPVTNTPTTSDLALVYTNSVPFVPYDKSSSIPYQIPSSEIQLANIRIWNSYYSQDIQSNLLNQNMVRDAANAIIIDNTNAQSRLPQLGTTN